MEDISVDKKPKKAKIKKALLITTITIVVLFVALLVATPYMVANVSWATL